MSTKAAAETTTTAWEHGRVLVATACWVSVPGRLRPNGLGPDHGAGRQPAATKQRRQIVKVGSKALRATWCAAAPGREAPWRAPRPPKGWASTVSILRGGIWASGAEIRDGQRPAWAGPGLPRAGIDDGNPAQTEGQHLDQHDAQPEKQARRQRRAGACRALRSQARGARGWCAAISDTAALPWKKPRAARRSVGGRLVARPHSRARRPAAVAEMAREELEPAYAGIAARQAGRHHRRTDVGIPCESGAQLGVLRGNGSARHRPAATAAG